MPLAGHTLIATFRHPANVEKAVGWIVAEPAAAIPGLGRKLPHYGKYSYLGFQGDEPANIIKGQWEQSDSPLRVDLRPEGGRNGKLAALPADGRKALAELPPVFSQQALREHVAFLASPDLKGRGLGSPGLDKAAQYVADRFKAYGLMPGGDGGSYFQRFTVPKGPGGGPVDAANVIGILPGSNDGVQGPERRAGRARRSPRDRMARRARGRRGQGAPWRRRQRERRRGDARTGARDGSRRAAAARRRVHRVHG